MNSRGDDAGMGPQATRQTWARRAVLDAALLHRSGDLWQTYKLVNQRRKSEDVPISTRRTWVECQALAPEWSWRVLQTRSWNQLTGPTAATRDRPLLARGEPVAAPLRSCPS
jgi:hypothetical protein